MRKVQEREARICCFDIETTNLVADFGTLLCVSWTFVGEDKIYTRALTDYPTFDSQPWNDKHLVRDVALELSAADVWVTWYGSRFDVPWLQTRLIYHKLKPMPPVPHVDGWRIAKYEMKMSNNRMRTVSAFLEEDEKTPVTGDVWVKARAGHRPSVKYVVDHCERDVRMLERVYHRIKPLCKNHPNIGLLLGSIKACPKCGAERLQKRGLQVARTRVYQRYQCTACGGWCRSRGAEKRTPPIAA